MSRSLYIHFRDNGFWAYDVPSSVFLKFLIDAASERLTLGTDPWLSNAIQHWRLSAVISELSRYADDEWSQSQIHTVCELCRAAVEVIRSAGDIPAGEIESWPILDEHRISTRGHDFIPCEPVARLGDAFIALLNGTLPEPPARHRWFFTLNDRPDTIAICQKT
ncbi:MAG: hypothetical protein MUC83_09105 [Pirellula sp.]|jgi:hypothetical protein|nr:hypothetical protein [Pirellula sp.]